jgi:hypothetical protein
MSDESSLPPGQQTEKPVELHPNSKNVKYEDLIFTVRESDSHLLINGYLSLLLQNVEKASSNFVVKASHNLRLKNGDLAKEQLDEYVYFLKEAQERFESLSELIEETLVAKSSTLAKITAQTGVPYSSAELNEMVQESQKEITAEKKRLKDRKESKLKAASKKESTKKASKKK